MRGSSAVKFQTLTQGAPVAQDQTNPIIVLKTSYVMCLHSFMSPDLTAILKMQWQKTEAILVVIYNEVFADTCCLKA